jgi:hypothetical protein
MMSFEEVEFTIKKFHALEMTMEAAEFLVKVYELEHPNFKGFELREKAEPNFILYTTEGVFGQQQIIRIPENTFEFPLVLNLNLLAHEMLHVKQKDSLSLVKEKNEREWQAYCEMLFHIEFPLIPEATDFHKKFFAKKANEYYNRMEENSELQLKYATQKKELEKLIANI